jgi:hypothetical protein
VISGARASKIEEGLAHLLDVDVEDMRDYVAGNIGESGTRRTGYRFIRGSHGGQYIRDPDGTDVCPAGVSVPA